MYQPQEKFVVSLAMLHVMAAQNAKKKKTFPGNVNEQMDFSGFEPCPPRTNEELH